MPSTLGIVASGFLIDPSDLPSLVGWWDASDAASFTYSSGTSVSQWDDRSGNGYHLVQATPANQPSRSGTINGNSAVVFDGSNDLMSVASFDMDTSVQTLSFAVVLTSSNTSGQVVFEHSANTNNFSGGFLFNLVPSNLPNFFTNRGSNVVRRSSVSVATAAKSVIATFDGTLSTDEAMIWVDGDDSGSYILNNNTNANNRNDTFYVGARSGSAVPFDGQIAELIVTSAVLSTDDRLALQAYFADKWGTG